MIWIMPDSTKLDFGLEVKVSGAKDDRAKLNHLLKWEHYDDRLYKSHPVKSEMNVHKMSKIILKDLEKLRGYLTSS